MLHDLASVGQRLIGGTYYHFRLLGHRPFKREPLTTVLAKLVKGQPVLVELGQRLVHGRLLVVVQPDLQVAADGGHVSVQVAPAGGRFVRAVGDEDILQGTHVQNLLGQAGSRFCDGKGVAALEPITLQAQHTHRVVHIQLDELELFTTDLCSVLHPRTQCHTALDQLHVTVELLPVLLRSLAYPSQVSALGCTGAGRQAG